MITAFKRALRKLTPLEVASRELAEAELQSLTAQTAVEYANSVVAYNAQRECWHGARPNQQPARADQGRWRRAEAGLAIPCGANSD